MVTLAVGLFLLLGLLIGLKRLQLPLCSTFRSLNEELNVALIDLSRLVWGKVAYLATFQI